MNIAFDAKRAFKNFTGLGNYSRFFIDALSQHYPEHQFLLFNATAQAPERFAPVLQRKNVSVHTAQGLWQAPLLKSLWRRQQLAKAAHQQGAHILHGLSNELPTGVPKGLKTVVTIHDLLFMRYPELYKKADRLIYQRKVTQACQQAHCVVAISQQTKQDLVQMLNVPQHKIKIVYQGCHPAFKTPPAPSLLQQVQQQYKLPQQFMLTVGRIEPRKNARLIIEAMHKHQLNLPLVIAGRPTAHVQELKALVQQYGLDQKVQFLSNVPMAHLPALYALSSVFLYPSLFEGFGIPIIEALNIGVPVVSTQGGCFAEAGGPNSAYVNAQDAPALAQAVNNIVSSPATAAHMVQAGKTYAQRFDDLPLVQSMMNVYKHVSAL